MTFLEKAHAAARAGHLDEVLRLTIAHFGAATGTIHLLQSEGVMPLRGAGAGIPEPVWKAVQFAPTGKGMAGLAAERKEPVKVCNLQPDSSGSPRPAAKTTGMEG